MKLYLSNIYACKHIFRENTLENPLFCSRTLHYKTEANTRLQSPYYLQIPQLIFCLFVV